MQLAASPPLRRIAVIAAAILVARAAPARADITAFIGANTTPANRPVRGFAVGTGLLIVGFEFEYAHDERRSRGARAPSLKTGMGNVLLQTPVADLRVPAVLHDRRRGLQRNARRAQRHRLRHRTSAAA